MGKILNLLSKFGHFRCFQFWAYSGLGASKIIFSEADLIQFLPLILPEIVRFTSS